MDVEWEKLLARARSSAPRRSFAISCRARRRAEPRDPDRPPSWRETVLRLPPEERGRRRVRLVMAQVAATLGMTPEDIDPRRPAEPVWIR